MSDRRRWLALGLTLAVAVLWYASTLFRTAHPSDENAYFQGFALSLGGASPYGAPRFVYLPIFARAGALAVGLFGERATTRHSPLLQVGGLRRPQQPVYRRLCPITDVPAGTMKSIDVDGHAILLANVDGEFLAVSNQCGDSPLPLQFSSLQGAELRCSWHGCRYDLRSGRRLDGDERLTVFPVAVESGDVRLALGTEPVPQG